MENLFDTINGPNNDEEFLPDGKKQWTSERYNIKINHINEIICDLKTPMVIGLCEIENKFVMHDIRKRNKKLRKRNARRSHGLGGMGIWAPALV